MRPDHLFVGDNTLNQRDKVRKGRQLRGERNGTAKLTIAQVDDIFEARQKGLLHREIADLVGISRSHVGNILRGQTWSLALADREAELRGDR